MRFIFPAILLASAWGVNLRAQQAVEFRGVWVARDSLGTREQVRETMRHLASANFNAVFVNVWSRGYPLWPSAVFERETGRRIDPLFEGRDIIREAIEEARPFGLAVFPWLEYGFVGGWAGYHPGESGRGPIFDRHPGWLARTRSGETRFANDFYWMSHAHPGARKFLIDLTAEILTRYDVPGVEFDRARYPQLDCGYDEATVEQYRADHDGASPPDNPSDPEWVAWRAANLNRFLDELYRQTKAADWRGLMTNAPIVYPFGYVNFAQAYPAWIRARSVDFISPQVYRATLDSYTQELDRQIAQAGDSSRLVPGIDVTNSRSAAVLGEMIEATRARGLPGFVVWYYGGLRQIDAWDALRNGALRQPARLPFRWKPEVERNQGLTGN
jgi:uncharacterized lipoprotein YddW (UPF0748 family)